MVQESRVVRIGLVQHACGPDPAANVDQTIEGIRDAASRGAQIVATQELFSSVYFPQTQNERYFGLAQVIPGPTSGRFCSLAKELGIDLVVSLFEQRAPGLYHNALVTIDTRGQIVNVYRKMHIPDDPGFNEKYYFTPGDGLGGPGGSGESLDRSSWQAVPTSHAQIGTLVCWDQWFPEAARLATLHGAEILFYPTAIGWHRDEPPQERQRQRDAWQVIQRAHAIANGVYVAAINRVGVEGDLEFWGSSFIADPGGKVIAEADAQDPQILVADCDLSYIERVRQHWPFLRDRRVDAYQGLTSRYLEPTRVL